MGFARIVEAKDLFLSRGSDAQRVNRRSAARGAGHHKSHPVPLPRNGCKSLLDSAEAWRTMQIKASLTVERFPMPRTYKINLPTRHNPSLDGLRSDIERQEPFHRWTLLEASI